MFYKAVGEEGKSIDDPDFEMTLYEIIIEDKIVVLPQFYWGFWKGIKLTGKVSVEGGKQFFIEKGLGEEMFDEVFGVLVSEGVIVVEK